MEAELERDMTPKLIEDLGLRYPSEKSRQKYRYGLYECQYCMNEWECSTTAIKNKRTKSCGCMLSNKNTSHGLHSNRFYSTWNKMTHRCSNPKDVSYVNYGGRGIKVCEEWLDPKNFIVWCEETYPNIEGVSLDRIDNDKGYSPENCTWSDKTTQAVNQRVRKDNKSGYVGVDFRPSENKYVARITVLSERVYLGYFDSIEEAVLARDNYITQNNLPHKLSTDYKRGES